MVLEPLSAFSVACNVLQIIEAGSKLLNNAVNYGKAADGALSEQQDLRNVLQSLKNLNADLRASMPKLGGTRPLNTAETRLLEANSECLRLSNEFIELLDRLKVKNRHAMLESLRMSIKALWYREKMEAMENNLSQARDNLNIAFLIYMNSQQATATSQSDILRSTTRLEGSILNAVNSSSGSIQQEVRLLAKRLENTSLGAAQQQTVSEFLDSNRDCLENLSDQLSSILTQNIDLQALAEERQIADAQQKILDSLHFPQIQERRHRIHEAHTETYQWVLRVIPDQTERWDNLVTWLSSATDPRRIYWICGKPGCGKSTLMRFLDENIRVREHMLPWAENGTVVRAQCFFWNPGHALQKSLSGLLRSLLMQLFEQTPNLVPQVIHLRKWRAARSSSSHMIEWSDAELRSTLHEYILNARKSTKVFLLIDGLDEFEGTDEMRDELIDLFTNLAMLDHVKICLSSRPWNIFLDAFTKFPQLRLEDLTHDDISKYVAAQLHSHRRFQHVLSRDRKSGEDLITAITDKAAGVFLWVRLVVRELLKGLRDGDSIRALWKTLEKIPADLNEYFKRLMDSISPENRLEASTLLQIALHTEHEFVSLHPLRLLDISFIDEERPDFALMGRYEFRNFDLGDREGLVFTLDSTLRRLNSRCMGLLECRYLTNDSLLDLYELEPEEEEEAAAYTNGINFESSLYPRIFEGSNLLHPFTLTVDFLHRSCRDFLLTPETQSLLHQYTRGPFDARMFLFNSRLVQFMALGAAGAGQNLALGLASYLMSVLSLRSWKEMPLGIVAATILQPPIESLCGSTHEYPDSPWYIEDSRANWHEEESSFLTLAIDFDLHGYIKVILTPERVKCKQGRPILDYILRPRFMDVPNGLEIGNSAPNLEILRRALELGANPNEQYSQVSVWALSLNFLADWLVQGTNHTLSTKQAYVGALTMLIYKGAAPLLPRSWLEFRDASDRFRSFGHDTEAFEYRWPKSITPVIEADGAILEPWYAVSDLLETFRDDFGADVDKIRRLLSNRDGILSFPRS